MARITVGSLAKQAKAPGKTFDVFAKELDVLLGIKTKPNGARCLNRDPGCEAVIQPEDYSWAELGEAICGSDVMRGLRDKRFGGMRGGRWTQTEDAGAGAMGPSQFAAINYWSETVAHILEAIQLVQYEQPEFIGSDITTLRPGIIQNVGRRTRYSPPTTKARSLQPNEPIPMGSMDGEWVDVNKLAKHGQGLAIATETMLFDGQQGSVVEAIGNIAYQIGWSKEDRILKPVFGIDNTYRYGSADSGGASVNYATYGTTIQAGGASAYPYTNLIQNLDLSDETTLDQVEQLFLALLNPRTGYPINMGPTRDVICCPFKWLAARRLARMTAVEQGPRALAPSAVEHTSTTWAGSVLKPRYSQRAATLMTQNFPEDNWTALTPAQAGFRIVYGDPKKAFEYREARPYQMWSWNMTQDPSLALHDCFMMVVALEQGSTTVIEPRHVILITNDSLSSETV